MLLGFLYVDNKAQIKCVSIPFRETKENRNKSSMDPGRSPHSHLVRKTIGCETSETSSLLSALKDAKITRGIKVC